MNPMKSLQTRDTALELRTGGQRLKVKQFGEDGTFTGHGSVFGVMDTFREIVAAGAFANSLEEHRKDGSFPAMLWQHDPGKPIGVWTEMKEDDVGLKVTGKLALDTQLGREAHSLLKVGALNGLSIGFKPVDGHEDESKNAFIVTEVDLWEVSLVTFPANGRARVEGVKSLSEIDRFADLERHLRDVYGATQSEATAIVANCKRLERQRRDGAKASSEIMASMKRLALLMN